MQKAWEIFDQPHRNQLDKPSVKIKFYLNLQQLNGRFLGKS
jgi:hypothetical protein